MKIGDPLDRSTDHGPQNHKAHLDKLVEYCQTGVKEGATLVCGGRQVQRPGKAAEVSKQHWLGWTNSDPVAVGCLFSLQVSSLNPQCLLMCRTTRTLLKRSLSALL